MKGSKPQFRRLHGIDKRIREGKYPNSSTLAEEHAVSARTIKRDIEFLLDQWGAPIKYDRSKHGYYYTEPNYKLPAIDISESDLFAIAIAEKTLQQYKNTPLFDRLKTVFDKILLSLPEKVTIDPLWVEGRVTHFPDAVTVINPEIWETIFKGLKELKTINISYQTPSHEESMNRLIDPYHCVSYQGNWYLVGHCHYKETILTFAFSRIKYAELQSTLFAIPEDFNFEDWSDGHFGIHWGDKQYTVKIQFAPETAPFIKERQWHISQKITKKKDGSIILSMKISNLSSVRWWVLSWGASAKIISPKHLVERIKGELQSSLKQYT